MATLPEDLEAAAANGAPTAEPEVWDERIPAFSPLFGHTPEPAHVAQIDHFHYDTYMGEERTKDLLRFSTAGSVDDGKSTLIGRLLYDTQSVYEDHVRSIEGKGTTAPGVLDLALLTDGLRAEREQGITIDVAYRYFSTARRKFIIADTPGHEQYTRNMATGASTASLAIVLVDARKGVLIQSRRHACITALLGVPHIVVAVNKMDLVDFSQEVFDAIRKDFEAFFDRLGPLRPRHLHFVPVSALAGDNVARSTRRMPWYAGPTLLELLEDVPAAEAPAAAAFRMAVQRVIRPDLDFRGFAGQIAAGTVQPGDAIMVLPSRKISRVRSIVTFGGELDRAFAPQSVTLTLEDELDISRGDLLVAPGQAATVASRFTASLVWMAEQPLALDRRYLLKHTSRTVFAQVRRVIDRLDVATLDEQPAETLTLNGIGSVAIETAQLLAFDRYAENRTLGSFVLIDPASNGTVAAGMIRAADEPTAGDASEPLTLEQRRQRYGHGAARIELQGSAAFLQAVERALFERGAFFVLVPAATPELVRALALNGVLLLVVRVAEEATLTLEGEPPQPAVDAAGVLSSLMRACVLLEREIR